MHRTLVPLVLLALIAPTAWALDPLGLQDDAGTGTDASDDAATPLAVAAGEHAGALDGALDRIDWYVVDVAADQRLRLDLEGTAGTVWFRAFDANGEQIFQTPIAPGAPRRWIGQPGVAHRFEFDPGAQSFQAGAYRFQVTLYETIPQDDAGTGIDVSSLHLEPGTYGGTLHPASFDLDDWYTIAKPWGGWVEVTARSTSGTPVTLDLYDPYWIRASATSTGETVTLSTWLDIRAIRVRTAEGAPAATYTFSFSWFVPSPPALDDAGLGIDAPGGWTDVPVLAAGTYEGRAHYAIADDVDRFAFVSPPGKYLQVTFELVDGTGTARVSVHMDDTTTEASDTLHDGQSVTFDGGPGLRFLSVERWFPNSGYNGGQTPSAEALYRITVRAVDRPDLSFSRLEVTAPPTGGYGIARRIVTAEVVNPSDAVATTSLQLYVEDTAGRRETIASRTVTLQPHTSAILQGIWMYSTYVGELTIGAASSCPTDPNAANDVREVRASALVDPGAGVGTGATIVRIG